MNLIVFKNIFHRIFLKNNSTRCNSPFLNNSPRKKTLNNICTVEFDKSHTMRASITYVSTWQKRANFSFLRANVPINVPMFQLGVPRTKRRANFSIWRASLPKGVPIFQTFLLRNTKENFDTSILRKKFYIILGIIVIHIICIYIVHKYCIILHFYTS